MDDQLLVRTWQWHCLAAHVQMNVKLQSSMQSRPTSLQPNQKIEYWRTACRCDSTWMWVSRSPSPFSSLKSGRWTGKISKLSEEISRQPAEKITASLLGRMEELWGKMTEIWGYPILRCKSWSNYNQDIFLMSPLFSPQDLRIIQTVHTHWNQWELVIQIPFDLLSCDVFS